jgi:RNA polymerase sigma factor (sigma-70 family)
MPRSLWAPLFAYSAQRDSSHCSRSPMDALAECRPQVETLVARILRRAKDDPDVQDCTNETLSRVMEQHGRRKDGSALVPWVLGIARHVSLDALRAEYRRRARSVPVAASYGKDDPIQLLPSDEPSPEAKASERQRMQELGKALASLPEQQREVLLALHLEGLSYREVAARFHVPIGTVGTWVLRGREALALALDRAHQPAAGPGKEDA